MSASLPGGVPPFESVADTRCRGHVSRPAVALCRSCLVPRCGECLVKIDGVNHCAGCLAALFPPAASVPGAARRAPSATAGGPAMAFLRFVMMALAYSTIALAAAGIGVVVPFFANERLLTANRERITNLRFALTTYYTDVGRYPDAARGLDALMEAGEDDAEDWRGPYTTLRATDGRPPRSTADEDRVLDVFGRPVVYYASTDREFIYIASPGANGEFETPGVLEGKAPRDESGDDVVQWIVWP